MARVKGEDVDFHVTLNAMYSDSIEEVARALDLHLPRSGMSVYRTPVAHDVSPDVESMRHCASVITQQNWASLRPDIIHVSSLAEGFGGRSGTVERLRDFPSAVKSATLYDLIPLIFSDVYLTSEAVAHWYRGRLNALSQCDLLLSISESSRQDAIRLLNIDPAKVVNIAGAVGDQFRPTHRRGPDEASLRQRYGITHPFCMYTGGIDHRKNVEGLIAAFARIPGHVRDKHQLLIVCSVTEDQKRNLKLHAERSGLPPDALVVSGFVPDHDLVALYNACVAFVFPSLYEGFGLPLLEAMSCGAPAIAANNSSLPEILGRGDALFDAQSADDMARALHKILVDDGFRRDLARTGLERAKSFSWDRSARAALDAFAEAHARKRSDRAAALLRSEKPRLAYFSPLPPMRSGIADYTIELLPYLTKWFSIDLFTVRKDRSMQCHAAGLALYDAAQYGGRKSLYDATILQLGNSELHDYMFEFINEHSGIVVLHDFYLSDVVHWIGHVRADPNFFRNALAHSHGSDAVAMHDASVMQAIMQYPASKRVLERAEFLIVHSRFSEQLIERFYPDLAPRLHRALIPHLRQMPRAIDDRERLELRARLGFRPDDVVVATFGFAAGIKATDQIVAAFLAPPLRDLRNMRLVVAGELPDDDFGASVKRRLASSGNPTSVRVTGFLDADAYKEMLWAADIAVQLRTATRGETSGTVLDALAHETAVIVNDFAGFREYPDDVLLKIPAEFTDADVAEALLTLVRDEGLRSRYAQRGRDHVASVHDPARVAEVYALAIAGHKEMKQFTSDDAVIAQLADCLEGRARPSDLSPIIDDLLFSQAGHHLGENDVADADARSRAAV